MSTPVRVIPLSPTEHTLLIPYLAAIHASCINHDRLIATFLPPLSHEKLLSWWKEKIAEIAQGTRLIWILIKDDNPSPDSSQSTEVRGPDVVGVVMLSMPISETGNHRAGIEKLLIHSNWRRKGGAKKLLEVLEEEAKERGRTMLSLHTETDTNADVLYKRLGYVELGKIPKYELSPTGDLKGCTFYYKQL